MTIDWKNLDELDSFNKLYNYPKVKLPEVLEGESGVRRISNYNVPMAAGLSYNYAAKQVDDSIIHELGTFAREAQLLEKFEALYDGQVINTGENRSVLHHLTRGQLGRPVVIDGVDKRQFYLKVQKDIAEFSANVHAGKIANEYNEKFTTVVQIGIGGSDLGPRALCLALEGWAKSHDSFMMKTEFVSNVDPDDAARILARIDIEHSLFILVSKSGTTLETLTNEAFVRKAIIERGLIPDKHIIAVTSQKSPLASSEESLSSFYMDDYIGGRYSASSAVGGVVMSLAFGAEVFNKFLLGAAEADKLAKEPDIRSNAALLDALIGVYERNVLGYQQTAILPYSQALRRFPAHLQQLDMESNGKSVNRNGEKLNYETGPIIFGEPGTNGQHSFYQLLHQGTVIVPMQFIGFRECQFKEDTLAKGTTSQEKLNANLVAQIIAFACGKDSDNQNRKFEGNRPSSLIVGDELSPEALGALLAHFENKIMFQGFAWNLNSFDQEGVQLGKSLANKVLLGDTDGVLEAYGKMFNL